MYSNIKFLQTGETWHILPEMGTFVVRIDAWDWSTGPTKLPSQKSQAHGRFSLWSTPLHYLDIAHLHGWKWQQKTQVFFWRSHWLIFLRGLRWRQNRTAPLLWMWRFLRGEPQGTRLSSSIERKKTTSASVSGWTTRKWARLSALLSFWATWLTSRSPGWKHQVSASGIS